jgi:MFS family permease
LDVDDRVFPAARPRSRARDLLMAGLTGPIYSLRRRHIPILGTYFGYGALGFTAVAETLWQKDALGISAAALASLAALFALPWSVKVLFGLLVDSISFARSSRRGWLLCGSGLVAAGMLLHIGNASGAIGFGSVVLQFGIATLLITTGVVLQDVVADALTSDIVPRVEADGSPRTQQAIIQEMAMVQVMGRFTLLLSMALVAWVAEWAAASLPITIVYAIGLAIPCLTAAAALFGEIPDVKQAPIDWMMLAGAAVIAAIVFASLTGKIAQAQEIVFVVSLLVVGGLLWRLSGELDPAVRNTALAFAVVAFAMRASPSIGEGYYWYSIDVLKFDQAFLSRLAAISSSVGVVGLWVMSQIISRNKQSRVLLWLVLVYPLLALPTLATVLGLHHWTEASFGIGAREIAQFETSFDLRVTNLMMIAMLTLTAFYAPEARRATWFTLMASVINLGLSAGALQTKYLNWLFPVTRGDYGNMPTLALATVAVGTIVPWIAVLVFGRRMA